MLFSGFFLGIFFCVWLFWCSLCLFVIVCVVVCFACLFVFISLFVVVCVFSFLCGCFLCLLVCLCAVFTEVVWVCLRLFGFKVVSFPFVYLPLFPSFYPVLPLVLSFSLPILSPFFGPSSSFFTPSSFCLSQYIPFLPSFLLLSVFPSFLYHPLSSF